MNCQNFESIINDLAREQMMDATAQAACLSHAASCASCAARLRDERALTIGLRVLAANVATQVEAPARVEASLLKAFRANARAAKVAPLIVQSPARGWRQSQWYIAAAMAAGVAFVMLLSLVASRPSHTEKQDEARNAQPLKTIQAPVSNVSPPRDETPKPTNVSFPTLTRQPRKTLRQTGTGLMREPVRPIGASVNSNGSGNALEDETNAGRNELTTDFYPLTYEASLAPLESGRVVRVELPRSALISMNLPMSMERADGSIKADVLLGDDGLAHAIRFIR
jgi:hypothetical protein